MCIAVFKPKGIDLPSKEILENCFTANSHGAGFAFAYDGRVYIKKGFMTFESFMDAFNFNNEKYNFKELGMLIHFRIATHGSHDATMTHPFPVIDDTGALQKTEMISEYAAVHNGIIDLTSADARKSGVLSDTAMFIKDYVTLISHNVDWFGQKCNLELIEKLLGSGNKMAILNSDGEIIHTRGFVESAGVYYSNDSYKDNYYRYGKHYGKGGVVTYDDYEYGDGYYSRGYNGTYWANRTTKSTTTTTTTTNTANNANNSNVASKKIALMKILPTETVEYDGFSQYIEADDEGMYYVDAEGNAYITDGKSDMPTAKESADYIYYFVLGGNAIVYTATNVTTPKEFKADIEVFDDQFPDR